MKHNQRLDDLAIRADDYLSSRLGRLLTWLDHRPVAVDQPPAEPTPKDGGQR
jgi:hypothetical protein